MDTLTFNFQIREAQGAYHPVAKMNISSIRFANGGNPSSVLRLDTFGVEDLIDAIKRYTRRIHSVEGKTLLQTPTELTFPLFGDQLSIVGVGIFRAHYKLRPISIGVAVADKVPVLCQAEIHPIKLLQE